MSNLTESKGTMFSRLKRAFRNEHGVVDLSSIITGVVVTGILGAVTAATLIVVIPWFQNKTAQDDANLVKIAQESYYSDRGEYGFVSDLQSTDLQSNEVKSQKYLHKTASTKVCVVKEGNKYTVWVQSKSKDIYKQGPADAKAVKSTLTALPTAATCQ